MLLWASKFATTKSSVASKWASKNLWGTIYYAVVDTIFRIYAKTTECSTPVRMLRKR